jgi:two-component system response regulator NreC
VRLTSLAMTAQAGSDGRAGGRRREVTVLLADDHEIVRDGLRMIIESEPDLRVVAEAGDAETACRKTLGHTPDILVLDLNMPGVPSLSLLPEIIRASPGTAVIVLTMQGEPALARESFRLGAKGFVVKHAAGRELVEAVHAVLAGDTYLDPSLGARLAAEPPGPGQELTPREREVLSLVALGHTNPEIAERLVISVRTVETHRTNIHRKLGTSTRAEVVRYAMEHGLAER